MNVRRGRTLIQAGLIGAGSILAVLLLALGAAPRLAAQTPPSVTPAAAPLEIEPPPPPVLLTFGVGNRLFQRGWVTFTRQPRARPTTVTIEMAPEVMGPQTAAIWNGHCTDVIAGTATVKLQLNDLSAGESITTLDNTSRSSLFDGTQAIAIQGTASTPDTVVACVDLPARHTASGAGPGPRQPR